VLLGKTLLEWTRVLRVGQEAHAFAIQLPWMPIRPICGVTGKAINNQPTRIHNNKKNKKSKRNHGHSLLELDLFLSLPRG
jgi:hypothetical protein